MFGRPSYSPSGDKKQLFESKSESGTAVRSLSGHLMKKVVVAFLAFLLSLSAFSFAQSSPLQSSSAPTAKPQATIPVDQIHTGMRGVAYTVFEGVTPES